jgi:hypothetical protein
MTCNDAPGLAARLDCLCIRHITRVERNSQTRLTRKAWLLEVKTGTQQVAGSEEMWQIQPLQPLFLHKRVKVAICSNILVVAHNSGPRKELLFHIEER